jgi:phosphatidylserine/phosphatidylglycerophosphate/cardiolipin synthase-like enzyme
LNTNMPSIQDIVIQFVNDLPEEYVIRVSNLLQEETRFDRARILHRLQSIISQETVQGKVRTFVENWGQLGVVPTPAEMAILITTASVALKYERNKQSLELICSGPQSRFVALRRTDQALMELVNSARHKIIIVSFAVYKAKNILSALQKAAKRGVQISIIVESPESSEGKITFDTISALGPELRSMAKIFIWPYAKREFTPEGKYGSLHAKVAVSDNQLYISSANLTEYAMNLNMEMGILITGGELPEQVRFHFDDLIANGTLTETIASLRN